MLVTFISQCEKKALKRTRRVLDAFANRIGDNVWQTAITEEGLDAVKKLLRKTATKSTAVACHRVRTRQRTELVWVVGNKRKFNTLGVVAVNRTRRNILHNEWENEWHYASTIQIVATISALLHDIGKSTVGFQHKLRHSVLAGDPYRHEWLSLKLFEKMIEGCDSDNAWLTRLAELDKWLATQSPEHWFDNIADNKDADETRLAELPPLAQWVAWLIASHHRLPPYKSVFFRRQSREKLKKKTLEIKKPLVGYYKKNLRAFDYWVKNPKSLEESPEHNKTFWQFKQLIIHSPTWQKKLKRWAGKALNDTTLQQLIERANTDNKPIDDTFLLYISRLCLMLGDHNYSSLDGKDKQRLQGDKAFKHIAANTDRKTKAIKQTLGEHLLGVGAFTARFARVLPVVASSMPTIQSHAPLAKATGEPRFQWQNRAYELACEMQSDSETHGFFGVNMASTGCGKTIGNARIMYGLSDPKRGARFTIALGLRVLTLQTGQSFRDNLGLSKAQLAILVGGQANRKLFEFNQKDNENVSILSEKESDNAQQSTGSESIEPLLDEWLDSDIDYQDYESLNLGTVIESDKARDLLFAPVVTCTVDHLMQASECKRGGKYIAPQLRLLSSDLILDEPDDFDHNDLPALSRLVHLAGLFGSRVLLSSATLTPDLIAGLFNAYRTGREHFNRSQNKPTPSVVCAWFDEQKKAITSKQCADAETFQQAHAQFTQQRDKFLGKQAVRRKAEILPLALNYNKDKPAPFYAELGQSLLDGALRLHDNHYQVDKKTQKHVSVGLIRIAHINNITKIIEQIFTSAEVPDDVQIHVSCYHSRQLLILRNALEKKLDKLLSRGDKDALCSHSEIQSALAQSPVKKHLFIVFATPVAEVGRDHDYDWAIVEPSSMRSIIQLAGRVWRHRPEKVTEHANILLLQYNLRYFTAQNNGTIFSKPGFETPKFRTPSYDLNELITEAQLANIDARPRIINTGVTDNEIQTLSDLEHCVMRDVLNNDKLNYVNAYWHDVATANRAHTHLQQISPFRAQDIAQEDWLIIPSDDSKNGFDAYYAEDVYEKGLAGATKQNKVITRLEHDFSSHPCIRPWLVSELVESLDAVQSTAPDLPLRGLATRYASVSLAENISHWAFSEFLGFVKK